MAPESQAILENAKKMLKAEGITTDSSEPDNKLEQHILPVLEKSRDIQSYLYSYEPPHASGIVRKAKNFVLTKFRNIIVNVMERVTMRQQKYNELLYQAIIELQRENAELKDQISKQND